VRGGVKGRGGVSESLLHDMKFNCWGVLREVSTTTLWVVVVVVSVDAVDPKGEGDTNDNEELGFKVCSIVGRSLSFWKVDTFQRDVRI